MLSGFISYSRAPFIFNVVALSLLVLIPLLIISIYRVKYRKTYLFHKRLQTFLGIAFVLVLIFFEWNVHRFDWRVYLEGSSFKETLVYPSLYFHIFCAAWTLIFWGFTFYGAFTRFPQPPRPNAHSVVHKKIGMLSFIFMVLTAITGWFFYIVSFVF